MRSLVKWLCIAPTVMAVSAFGAPAYAQDGGPAGQASRPETTASSSDEIIVTAQKREQNINDVGMSINAVSGADLAARGALDPFDLAKVVPGFQANANAYGNPIYSVRGVGFQDATLGASPTVTVYVNEVPIPFSAETVGVGLDLARLEVLKGPQGTLYGENATGGALNYIAAAPTDTFEAGVDASYGRFSTADVSGFLSGPLGDTLNARLALRVLNADDWQQSYTRSASLGKQDLMQGRLLLDWTPTDKLKVSVNLNGWQDRSESPAPQVIGIVGLGSAPLLPALTTYPLAPNDARAADWDAGRDYARDTSFAMGAVRADYDITNDITLSSISSLQKYSRIQPIEGDGTNLEDQFIISRGSIETVFQEFRLTSRLNDRGNLIAGVNYQADEIYAAFNNEFADSSSRNIAGFPLTESFVSDVQNVDTYAAYGSFDYDLTDTINVQAGARYTKSDRSFVGCNTDVRGEVAALFGALFGTPIPVGGCTTINTTVFAPQLSRLQLNEDNVSWRVGVNWDASPDTLLYANVSQGYKAGSYPTLVATSTAQFKPVVQEGLLAYEAGFKSTLGDTLQFNGAVFYYDYQDKQILGRRADPVFGPLQTLINVPESHVAGVELQMTWRPMPGLTITPGITYIDTEIDGSFVNYDSFGVLEDFGGQSFPNTPDVQATLGTEYRWNVGETASAFLGADLSYQSKTNGALGEDAILDIKSYTLLDLRAGVEQGNWVFSVWGRNVTDEYYWHTATRINDTVNRYAAMPATYGVGLSYRFH